VHCLNGQQATGCIIGLLRKSEGWALSAIFDEYRRHVTGGRVHVLDLQLIELWPIDRTRRTAALSDGLLVEHPSTSRRSEEAGHDVHEAADGGCGDAIRDGAPVAIVGREGRTPVVVARSSSMASAADERAMMGSPKQQLRDAMCVMDDGDGRLELS
jgi:hypothetical protein